MVGSLYGFPGCWLVHYLSLLRADFEIIVITGLWNSTHTFLHLPLCWGILCHVIDIEKLIKHTCLHLWFSVQPKVEQLAIKAVTDWKAIITVLKASVSMAENTMLNSVGASTQPCWTPFVKEILHHSGAIMQLPHHSYKPDWTAKRCHDFPTLVSTDCVKCFGKVM